MGNLHIIFDGPPGPTAPRFIECETPDGYSVNVGTWRQRSDGLWALVIPSATALQVELAEARALLRDLGARAMTDDLVKRLRDDFETLADLIEAASQAADRIEELEAAIREMTGV